MSNDDVSKAKDNNVSKEISEAGNIIEKSTEERINAIIRELNDLIKDIANSRQINQAVTQSQALNPAQSQVPKTNDISANVNTTLIQTAQTLAALNSIKSDLCRLPLDFCEREYISNCVTPLVTAMEFLARTGFDLATSVSILTSSPIVPRKKGKLKDTIHTVYSINEDVEDIYKILKKRFKTLTWEANYF